MLIADLLVSFSHPLIAVAGTVIFIYLISTTLALRGLISSVRLVIDAVNSGNLDDARRKLSMIVGRDTGSLGEEAILRAAIETLAENLSDGFGAPLFYLVIGGLPLGIAYKAVNTLDSMVGYKNERYMRFGWAAARLDDAANYIPARITGLAISAAAFLYCLISRRKSDVGNRKSEIGNRKSEIETATSALLNLEFRIQNSKLGVFNRALEAARTSFRVMRRDGRNHTSPNSGLPEAAMAGALGVRLGGPSTYGGVAVEKPYIGEEFTGDYLTSARQAVHVAVIASCLMMVVALSVLCLFRGLL
jgi:adenosylcobinamide-phosphate synthase